MIKKMLVMVIAFIMAAICFMTGCESNQSNNGEATSSPTPIKTVEDGEIVVAVKNEIDFNTAVVANVDGNSAKVKTSTGLEYTAEGFDNFSDGKFNFKGDFKIVFNAGTFAKNFNRYTICYESSKPLKGTIAYNLNGKSKKESFFLEKGKNTFNCLIESYLKGSKANGINYISFESCSGGKTNLVVCDVLCEDYEVYTNDTYYVENARYKVGIRLLWGGGISYISDSQNTVKDLSNLVNQADEGRLIQQSYYGTGGNNEYKPGEFNNSVWAYNPVQGGDKYRNHSRIIDIVVEDFSVYIKAQPQDWSLDNKLTPSYMENSYTIYENYIRVDNKFVDFSGWEHRYAHQELPAFYTVSYLNTFTWYDGSSPWQDDELTSRSDLKFWGDPKYAGDCRMPIKVSNTETWCAWTNKKDDYGIGIYVPNVDTFLAGKNAYNASKDAANGACNYVAPINTMKMVSFSPIEYSYIMTTGSLDEIREVFKANKDFATNESLHKNYQSMRVKD